MATARNYDVNGWPEIKGNPISKAGIFEYLGSTINAPEPDRIYRVYRPSSELSDPACIESFKLLPWIIEHEMLGDGETPAERKGIQGVIGEDVFFDDGYLKGNIKVFSDHLSRLIESGMKELSLGYKCNYEFTSGSVNGQPYDAIQTDIRGNHIATVEEGRMGPDVAVMDKAIITFDSAEFLNMARKSTPKPKTKAATKPAEQSTGQDGEMMEQEEMDQEMSLADISMAISKLMPLMEEVEKLKATMSGGEEAPMMEQENMDDDYTDAGPEVNDGEMMDMEHNGEDEEEEGMDQEKNNGMDSVTRQLVAMRKEIATLRKQQAAMDSKTLMQSISRRDQLAARLSHFIGTFDHASKTHSEVAAYGVDQLKIPCQKGQEIAAITAWLHDRKPQQPTIAHSGTFAMDSTDTNPVDELFKRA